MGGNLIYWGVNMSFKTDIKENHFTKQELTQPQVVNIKFAKIGMRRKHDNH